MLFDRRFKFALVILASQLLLIALAVVMLIQLLLIEANGSVLFVENNQFIRLIEIISALLITSFGVLVFTIQVKRLGEKRKTDSRERRRNSANEINH